MDITVDLIKDMRSYIKSKTGIFYFKDIRKTPNNIIVTCPFHKDGQETKPSATIRTTPGERTYIGNFHCFTCGKSVNLQQMLQEILGEMYDEADVNNRFELNSLIVENMFKQKPIIPFKLPDTKVITEDNLRKYRYYNTYLESRRINEETAMKFDIGYDNVTNDITFPIRDINHNVLAIGRRNITRKIYRYPQYFTKPLYGIYELPEHYNSCWVCEGPFNLWSLTQWGKTGVALLGTGTDLQRKQLTTLTCKNYVLALDPDDAGRKGTRHIIDTLLKSHKYNIWVADIPEGKDINDLTQDEFKQVLVLHYKEWIKKYSR